MNKDQEATLLKWRARTKRAQLAHGYTAVSYGRYNLALGVLLICLTTASSVLIFARDVDPNWLSPAVGISAALFAYLQTFLQLAEKANLHREVARRYGAMKKEIEYVINFESEDIELRNRVQQIKERGDEISANAPHALSHRWEKAKAETKKENEVGSMRNRT